MALLLLAGVACDQIDRRSEGEKRIDERTEQVTEFERKREANARRLSQMDVAELARTLAEESRRASDAGTEPFNSMAFKEAVSRREAAAEELKVQLKASDRTSLLGLLALRQMGQAYRELDPGFRVAVLVDALQSSKYFNTWGLPHAYWEDAAQAIIDEGREADGPLRRLLADERPAPSWGSDEVVEYKLYQYRVRDYAWALLLAIRGEKSDIPTDPAERDRLISGIAGPG